MNYLSDIEIEAVIDGDPATLRCVDEPYPYRFLSGEDGKNFLADYMDGVIVNADHPSVVPLSTDGREISSVWHAAPFELRIGVSETGQGYAFVVERENTLEIAG